MTLPKWEKMKLTDHHELYAIDATASSKSARLSVCASLRSLSVHHVHVAHMVKLASTHVSARAFQDEASDSVGTSWGVVDVNLIIYVMLYIHVISR